MLLQEIYDTEKHAHKAIGIFEYFEGYYIFRSPKFPTYWMGNGIEIQDSTHRNFADWERLSERYFDPEKYQHRTFTFLENPEWAFLKESAKAAGYEVTDTPLMFASKIPDLPSLANDWKIRQIETPEDFGHFRHFKTKTNPENEWFANEGFDKTRVKDAFLNTEWYCITPKNEWEILAAMGIFRHHNMARLQEVDTHPAYRRRGFASQLLRYLLDRAIRQWGCKGLSLFSDSEAPAVGLYRKMGFEVIGYQVELLRTPQ
ncbi:MAG: GNAT family N-acetyltransferase [Chitinophagales bacterium]